MNTTPTPIEILEGVRQDVSDCLSVELEETKPESTFFIDLDGESIDVIDLMFRCEKRFGVRVELQSLMSELQLGPDGRFSADSVCQLQAKVPEIDWPARIAAIGTNDPRGILTVDLISELVQSAIRANELKPETCEAQSD